MAVQQITFKKITKFNVDDPNFKPPPQPEPEEINGITEPQLVAGHPEYNHSINATAHKARLSSLQIEERPR